MSIFVNVDPLVEKTMTSYAYVNNNPVMLVDPDGMSGTPSFSIGLSYGTGGLKANFNFTVDQKVGDFTGSYGFGVTYHSNFFLTSKKGFEFRNSFMINYDDGKTGGSLGTNIWGGTGGMKDFGQRTGMLSFRRGDFKFSYENDGTPFQYAWLGDGNDSYRTAAASIGLGAFSLNMNLVTGLRNTNSYFIENNTLPGGESRIPQGKGIYGENYKHGFVFEQGPTYRYGGLTLNYGGVSAGVNSEWVRHSFQNVLAHDIIQRKRPSNYVL